MKNTKKNKVQGFTLIEVMVSLAIFAIVSIGLLNISSQISSQAYRNQQLLVTRYVAELYAAEAQLELHGDYSVQTTYLMGHRSWAVRPLESSSASLDSLLTSLRIESGSETSLIHEVFIP